MKPDIKRIIERELYHYLEDRRELEELKNEIILRTPENDGTQNGTGNPVANTVIKLMSSRKITVTEARLRRIEEAINLIQLNEDPLLFKVMKLKYFDKRLTDKGIVAELNISESTLCRWKNKILRYVGESLGRL